jgi:hypothetical protein
MYWQSSDDRVTLQPARGFSQRISDFFSGTLTIEDQL